MRCYDHVMTMLTKRHCQHSPTLQTLSRAPAGPQKCEPEAQPIHLKCNLSSVRRLGLAYRPQARDLCRVRVRVRPRVRVRVRGRGRVRFRGRVRVLTQAAHLLLVLLYP